jgi:pilus assembly protein Flp/PilA
MNLFKKFFREQEGQDAIEYALLAGFVSLTIVAMVTTLGTDLNKVYTNVDTQVKAIPAG